MCVVIAYYEFAELTYPEQRVGLRDGHCELVPFRPAFDKDTQYNVIAFPIDLSASIPRSNAETTEIQAGL